ncbi:MAG TPA: HAD-IIB family hydrolase [Gemmatimonadaceae bacterium]|nr:HAD-IIB family hydrolase [Gemmatimonadaceae bacterium]
MLDSFLDALDTTMAQALRGIILSDVDGTFIDDAYQPAMDRVQFASVLARWRVIWVSSRTADELLHLQAALGHADDAIAENGGVIVSRDTTLAKQLGAPTPVDGAWMVRVAAPRDETTALVRRVFADEGVAVRTFDDIDAEQLAHLSRYSRDDATRALKREASAVLINVASTEPGVVRALAHLRDVGCDVTNGGRWVSVVRGSNKGEAARAWLAAARTHTNGNAPRIVAIGDAENDAALLAVADHRFVIAHIDRGHHPALASYPGARTLRQPGIAGWREMLDHLADLD